MEVILRCPRAVRRGVLFVLLAALLSQLGCNRTRSYSAQEQFGLTLPCSLEFCGVVERGKWVGSIRGDLLGAARGERLPFHVIRKMRPMGFHLQESLGFKAWIAASRRVYLGSDVPGDPTAKPLSIGGTDEAEFTRLLREAAMQDTSARTPELLRQTARLALDTVHLLEFNSPDSASWFDRP